MHIVVYDINSTIHPLSFSLSLLSCPHTHTDTHVFPCSQLPSQNNDNNYHLYASAVITCTRAEHAFNFVSNLNNSNKSLLPALLLPPTVGTLCTLYDPDERYTTLTLMQR